MKRSFSLFVAVAFGGLMGCSIGTPDASQESAPTLQDVGLSEQGTTAKGKTSTLDAPAVTVLSDESGAPKVRVCAGRSGAPNGFVVQWHLPDALWPADTCGSGALGGSGQSMYGTSLGSSECVEVFLKRSTASECSAPPLCEGGYRFRSFAHATSTTYRSPFSSDVSYECATPEPLNECAPDDWECYCNRFPVECS